MRWFLGITALAAAIVGGIIGGGLLLPRTVEVSRTAAIDRPAMTVFTLLASLRAFPDYSPWRTLDPATVYTLEGAPADGAQRLTWRSDHPLIGQGEMSLSRAEAPRLVEHAVRTPKGPARLTYALTPQAGGVTVAWTLQVECPAQIRAVMCRYATLFARGRIAADLEKGLRQLKSLAESVPAADFSGLEVAFTDAKAQTFAYVEGESVEEPSIASPPLRQSLGLVTEFFSQAGLAPTGPAIMLTAREDERWTFRAGFPFEGPAAVSAETVKVGQTPAGPAVRALHDDDAATLSETYEKLAAFLAAHRLTVTAGPWEVYRTGPDGEPTTEIWALIE